MTEQVFVVLERGFDYNDETYDYQEGGNIITAFRSREEAEHAALTRTVAEMNDAEYFVDRLGYDVVLEVNGFGPLCDVDDRDDLIQAVEGLSLADREGLARHLDGRFFYVQATQLDQMKAA